MIHAKDVDVAFKDCLYRDEEIAGLNGAIPEGALLVEGVVHKFGFHPERVAKHREEIRLWLRELPDEFHKGKGDGWSFLNACTTRDGDLWGQHINVEQLICLGIAAGFAHYMLPRDMWSVLPGGVPYIGIDTEAA